MRIFLVQWSPARGQEDGHVTDISGAPAVGSGCPPQLRARNVPCPLIYRLSNEHLLGAGWVPSPVPGAGEQSVTRPACTELSWGAGCYVPNGRGLAVPHPRAFSLTGFHHHFSSFRGRGLEEDDLGLESMRLETDAAGRLPQRWKGGCGGEGRREWRGWIITLPIRLRER